jgi:hypothetical protein
MATSRRVKRPQNPGHEYIVRRSHPECSACGPNSTPQVGQCQNSYRRLPRFSARVSGQKANRTAVAQTTTSSHCSRIGMGRPNDPSRPRRAARNRDSQPPFGEALGWLQAWRYLFKMETLTAFEHYRTGAENDSVSVSSAAACKNSGESIEGRHFLM